MKKNKTLIQKINDLFKKSRIPKWLHHFGPKKYLLKEHLLLIFLKEKLRLSYREIVSIASCFRIKKIPHYTTLQKLAARLPVRIWMLILRNSINAAWDWIAIDGTGISRTSASCYYYYRIDRIDPINKHVQLLIAVDIKSRNIVGVSIRSRPVGEAKQVPKIYNQFTKKPNGIVMDKGFDSEELHRFLRQECQVDTLIPVRKNFSKGYYRKEMAKRIPCKQYHQRSIVESIISSIKRKYGVFVRSKKIATQRSEILSRLIMHNILCIILTFSTEPEKQKVY
jgi:transposase